MHVLDMTSRVYAMRSELHRRGHDGSAIYDGAALSLLDETAGDVERAVDLAVNRRVPGTYGISGCRQIGTDRKVTAPTQAIDDYRTDQRVQAKLDLVMAELAADGGEEIEREVAAALVQLSEATVRAAARNQRHLLPASSRHIAQCLHHIRQCARDRGTYSVPWLTATLLYPQVNAYASNLGFRDKVVSTKNRMALNRPAFDDTLWEILAPEDAQRADFDRRWRDLYRP